MEGPHMLAQVKHVRRLSLTELEAVAVEMAERGETSRKLGIVVVKRRVGRGVPTQRLVVMTDAVFETLVGRVQQCPKPVADAAATGR